MKNFNLDAILEAMLKMSERVSDLNFSVGRQPQVEIDGQLAPVNFPGLPRLTPYQTEMIAMHMLRGDREATRTLVQSGSVDVSYSIPGKTRFRVNIFSQRGTYAIVPNIAIPTSAMEATPAATVLCRNSSKGRIGSRTRRSTTPNAMSRTAAATKAPIT